MTNMEALLQEMKLDATLRELASLVKQVNAESRQPGTRFDFALVTPDQRSPFYRMRLLGVVCSGSPSDSDRIMLKDSQFQIGDMIDVSITPPNSGLNTNPLYPPRGMRDDVVMRRILPPTQQQPELPSKPRSPDTLHFNRRSSREDLYRSRRPGSSAFDRLDSRNTRRIAPY